MVLCLWEEKKHQMAVIFKQFTTHKRGENDEDIQDSINVNIDNGRFALSDGVSRSFLPRLLADILTEAYVNASVADDFPQKDIVCQFSNRKEAYLSALDDFSRTLQDIAEETLKVSAATFVGLEIGPQLVSWKVIGDSCLFIIPDNGNLRCVCSDETTIDGEGTLKIHFGNNPAQIHSDGSICGQIISGSSEIKNGWYIIMSDAMSAWFVDRLNNKEDVIDKLFALGNNEDFEKLVQEEFDANRLKNDDCSVIIIHINANEVIKPVDDEPPANYFDIVEQDVDNLPNVSLHNKVQATLSNVTGFIRSFIPNSNKCTRNQEQDECNKELY